MILLIGYIPLFIYVIWAVFQLIDASENPRNTNVFILQSIPSTLVTTGVLGTFLGIAIGLHYFNLDEIESSIDELLGGLKTAFGSSVVGITLSIIASIYIKNFMMKYGELMKVPESEETKEIKLIQLQNASMERILEDGFESLKNSLGQFAKDIETGNSQTMQDLIESLDNRTEEIVETMQANNALMVEKFDHFSELLANANVKALQAAFEELITNFDDTFQELITSLVDQNFEELTNSVNSLNEWQIQNRQDIDNLYNKLDKLLKQSDKLVDKVEQSTTTILDNIESSSNSMAKIAASTTTLVGNDSLLVNIINDLESIASDEDNNFKAMVDKLSKAVTEFEEEKRQITNWLNREKSIHGSMVSYTEGLIQFTNALKEFEKVKEHDIDVFTNTFKDEIERGLHKTFLKLDSLLKEYVNFLETDNARRTVQIEFKSKKQ